MKIPSIIFSTLLLLFGNQGISQTTTESTGSVSLQLPENQNVEYRSSSRQQFLEGKILIPNQHYKISTEEKILRREEEREVMIKSNPTH